MIIRAFQNEICSFTLYSLGGVPNVPKPIGKWLEPYPSYVFCKVSTAVYDASTSWYLCVGYVYVLAYPTRVDLHVLRIIPYITLGN